MALSTITDIRDIVIIITGIIGVLGLGAFLIFTVVLGFLSFRLLRSARKTVGEGLPPILEEAQDTMRSVKGTADFIGDSAAGPVIRAYGIVAGIQRGFGVLANRANRGGKK